MLFTGEYEHSVDAKGRIIMPSKFRDALADEFVVTLGLDGCLFVYSNEEWEQFVLKLKDLPGNKEARQLQRYFLAGAASVEMDKQGRFLIPQKLRDAAGLTKDIVTVGVLTKLEIWSKEKWEANNIFENMDEIAEHMSEFNLKF